MILGDMEVFSLEPPPAKFVKALAAISAYLHDSFDEEPWITPQKSKTSCVLSSLAVRDFLWKIGYLDAAATPCLFMIRAYQGDEEIHSLGIGLTDHQAPDPISGYWNGHMVVRVPSVGYIIDATLYQAMRPQWAGMRGMMAVRMETRPMEPIRGMRPLAALETASDDGSVVTAAWLHNPANKGWRSHGGDDDSAKWRRANVIKKLVARFGQWKG